MSQHRPSPPGQAFGRLGVRVEGTVRRLGATAEVDLLVPADHDGPTGILQGGFAAALPLVAAQAVDVFGAPPTYLHSRLHRPTPLSARLTATLEPDGAGRHRVTVRNGDQITVTGEVELAGSDATPRVADLAPLATVMLPMAQPQFEYPNCVVCGTENPVGLKVVPHPRPGDQNVAPWAPGEELDDGDGHVSNQVVAAALDCPGVWANWNHVLAAGMGAALLADFHIRFFQPLPVMEAVRTIAVGDGVDGRKLHARSVVMDEDAMVYAVARALHIAVPGVPDPPTAADPWNGQD